MINPGPQLIQGDVYLNAVLICPLQVGDESTVLRVRDVDLDPHMPWFYRFDDVCDLESLSDPFRVVSD